MLSNYDAEHNVDWLAVVDGLEADTAGDRGPGELLEGPTREAFLDLLPYAEVIAQAAEAYGG